MTGEDEYARGFEELRRPNTPPWRPQFDNERSRVPEDLRKQSGAEFRARAAPRLRTKVLGIFEAKHARSLEAEIVRHLGGPMGHIPYELSPWNPSTILVSG